MRKLHVVGYSADQGGLVLAARRGARTGSFVLALDHSLLEQIEAAQADPVEGRAEVAQIHRSAVDSGLTPREIQTRLRAGRSVQEVASEARVSVDWVDRFAAPVLAEQAAAVERAGRAVLHTSRRGLSDRTLEASVLRNLALRGAILTDEEMRDGWSARHLIDSDWLITFRFRNRGRVMTAEWMFNAANGALTSRTRLGTELGFIEPARRPAAGAADDAESPVVAVRPTRRRRSVRRPVASRRRLVSAPVKKRAAKKAAAKRATARKVTVRKATVRKATVRKAPVKKAPVKKAAVKKAPVKKAPVRKTAVKKAAVRKTAIKRAPVKKAAVKRAAVKKAAVKRAAVKKAAVKSAAVKKAAVKKAVVKRVPVKKASVTKKSPVRSAVRPRSGSESTVAPIRVAAARIESPRRRATIAAAERGIDVPPVGAHFAPRRDASEAAPAPPGARQRPGRPRRANRPLRAERSTAPEPISRAGHPAPGD
jgi:hypothetical protein